MTKDFKTVLVASAATGIGVMREGDSFSYSDLQEFYSHVLGFPIWTHEMGTGPLMDIAKMQIRELFPEIPARDYCADNPCRAAQIMIDIYGETVAVEKGVGERPADPIATLKQMVGDKPIAVIKAP